MVNNNTSSEVIDEFSPFDGFKESLEYADSRISELEAENSKFETENSELKARIKELEDQINGKQNIYLYSIFDLIFLNLFGYL